MKTKRLLTIDQLLFFELAKLMYYKVYPNDCPESLSELFVRINNTRTTRSRRNYYSSTPRIQLTRQSLNYRGNIVWEKIPYHVKYTNNETSPIFQNFISFKYLLKEYILDSGDEDVSEFIL